MVFGHFGNIARGKEAVQLGQPPCLSYAQNNPLQHEPWSKLITQTDLAIPELNETFAVLEFSQRVVSAIRQEFAETIIERKHSIILSKFLIRL
jgi:hypothetical protein